MHAPRSRLKVELRALGVEVDGELSDAAAAEEDTASRSVAGSRQHSQIISGDSQVGVAVAGDNYGSITINQPAAAKDSAALERQRGALRPEDRAAMLANLRRIWIDGVLKQSLWNDALLTLRMAEQPDAVQRPYGLRLKSPDGDAPLPTGSAVQNVFDAQQGLLLILGEPGSGKTTLLLELTRTLLDRADADTSHPVPVVFNLAFWGEQQHKLDIWMVAQLNREYSVPKKIGQAIVAAGALLPLLDGLDEVSEDRRAACVEAINAYRAEHETAWTTPLVVCCRLREYEALPKLQLYGAVLVQPLTRTEVDTYLHDGGRALTDVRAVIKDDPTLYELLQTPLMLAVTTLAFAGRPVAELQRATSLNERRRAIFAAFVDRQFQPSPEGRGIDPLYRQERTLHWLAWLARLMRAHDHSIYWIEFMQLGWLSRCWMRWAGWAAVCIIVGLVGVLAGMLSGVLGGALLSILMSKLNDTSGVDELGFLLSGLIGGLTGVMLGFNMNDIKPVDAIRWNRHRLLMRSNWSLWQVAMLGSGLLIGLGGVLGVPGAGSLGLGFVLLTCLLVGLDPYIIDQRKLPNEGLRRSIKSGLTGGLVSGLGFGLVFGLFGSLSGPVRGLGFGLAFGLSFGLGAGLAFGLLYGGNAVIKHYTLRLLLWLSGAFPWNITAFLDSCAQRRLIQRVGGGWRFPHNLIRDYFAELDIDQESNTEAQKL